MLITNANSCSDIVILKVRIKLSNVLVARKSLSMFGIKALIMAKAVKVKPKRVENTVEKKGTDVRCKEVT
jgi:hypothetical protein